MSLLQKVTGCIAVCLLPILFTACAAGLPVFPAEAPFDTNSPPAAEPAPPPGITLSAAAVTDDTQDGIGVTLEVSYAGPGELILIITNNTDKDVTYDDGHSFTQMVDGRLTAFGSWAMGFTHFTLPSGESREIRFDERILFGPGEFRMGQTVTIDGEEHEVYVDFAIEDETIGPEIDSFIMALSLAGPRGALLELTNGFSRGRVYFDRNYRLLQNIDGVWQNVPDITTRFFPEALHHVAPGQTRIITKNWGWLHGELEPGDYRIEKSFWHNDDYELTRHDLYVEFTWSGGFPSPPSASAAAFDHNPFRDTSTFQAEVISVDNTEMLIWNRPTLLVRSITPMWGGDRIGGLTHIVENDSLAVLDAGGEPMLFTDINPGAVVEITFSGRVHQSHPAILSGAILISVVE